MFGGEWKILLCLFNAATWDLLSSLSCLKVAFYLMLEVNKRKKETNRRNSAAKSEILVSVLA